MPGRSEVFYENLSGFEDFTDVTDLSLYVPLPDDWFIVVADIKGSTKAIKEGRYKDVNLMGAACITAVINALSGFAIPYVFGGDGATMAVPLSATGAVKRVLGAARRLSQNQFGLELRAGIVPVGNIRDAGADVRVAKFQLSPGNFTAMFSGGGVQLADTLIKAEEGSERFEIALPEGDALPDLSGLSCRWEPLQSCRGTMMSMLIYATGRNDAEKAETYHAVIEGVGGILQGDPGDSRPVSADNMVFKWPSRGINNESKLMAGARGRTGKWLRLYATSFVQYLLEKFDLSAGGYNAPIYREELRTNSDFRRFDDMLRMILDCPIELADEIENYFLELHRQGKIAFGTHRSDQALMTCLVFSLTKGEHIHFVDGSDGGFAMAAVQLKAQMRTVLTK
ncbi:MAG: DUF3095 domain-containing protein [Rhodospirillales bacterium]|nr:DUF3095 domain-containing protein [Alphaproteobacteria bacterium]MBL6928639.1 DUF3095 domain-containing protein [Rhodospirillales bacterium]